MGPDLGITASPLAPGCLVTGVPLGLGSAVPVDDAVVKVTPQDVAEDGVVEVVEVVEVVGVVATIPGPWARLMLCSGPSRSPSVLSRSNLFITLTGMKSRSVRSLGTGRTVFLGI